MPYDPKMLTGPQLRAARALVNMSGEELADATKLALSTIRRAEGAEHETKLTRANAGLLVEVLERAGVQFVHQDRVGGPGVRIRKR